MKKVNEMVYQIGKLRLGQVYLIKEDNQITLVDTGKKGDFKKITKQLNEFNINLEDVDNIIITHSHQDHVGSLKELTEAAKARVLVHEHDKEEIDKIYNSEDVEIVSDKQILDILGGLEVIHIPGHTDGNIALYSIKYKLLLAGDCVFNNIRLSLPPIIFNSNTKDFKKNVKVLLDYDIEIICPGHGNFINENAKERLSKLLDY